MRRLGIVLLLLFLFSPAVGEDRDKIDFRWSFSPQVGTDFGMIVPFPINAINGVFNAYPQVSPSMGFKSSFILQNRWVLAAEFTYKTLAMTADTRVDNQMLYAGEGGERQYFSGTAFVESKFTQFEVPFYLKYLLGKSGRHRLLLGGYCSYNLNSIFKTQVRKGYIGSEPNVADMVVDPQNPLTIDLSSSLSNWDAGVVLGYEYGIGERLNLGFRMMTGLKDIFQDSPFENRMIHVMGTLVVSYNIFLINRR